MIVFTLLLGCPAGSPTHTGPMAVVDHEGEFWDAPWPSDQRRSSGGGLSMEGFPGVVEYPLVDLYAQVIENDIDGASTTGPVFFRFEDTLDTELLPTPRGALYPGASVFLVDIDRSSPERGRRFPLRFDFQEEATRYQADNQLAVAPLPGTPLRPGTTYATVVTTDIARRAPAMTGIFEPSRPTTSSGSPWPR